MDYVSTIANSLLERSFCGPLLGFEIYTMIAEWEKDEIPLAIVTSSIDEYCAARTWIVNEDESIARLRSLVNANFRSWLQLSDMEQHISLSS